MGIELLLNAKIGKRKTRIFTIVFLLMYMCITGFSPSVVRAGIMYILILGASILHRKNDTFTSISLSLLVTLIYNPFLITNIGLQFSYLGTVGIIILNKNILEILMKIRIKNKKWKYRIGKGMTVVVDKIRDLLAVTISAQLSIFPIMIFHFNVFGTYFLITNLLVSIIIAPLIIISMLTIISLIISKKITQIIFTPILRNILKFLILISNIGNLPFSKIYFKTPKIISILVYYFLIIICNYFFKLYNVRKNNQTEMRVRNVIALAKYKVRRGKKQFVGAFILIVILISTICVIPKDLEIHFVDVGQGDCTFIVTPKKKTILIDGGGNSFSNFDVGKSTLIPYLLDRGFTKIDYIIISHFDFDHSQSYAKILPELTVSRIFITEQIEENDLFKQIMAIAKKKNIEVTYVKAGDKINIDGVKFSILHPQKELMTNNGINNNSMVCKLEYNSFSMLFTGDIEKEAEELILNKNIDLKADVLKVAHHRFKNFNDRRIFKSSIS